MATTADPCPNRVRAYPKNRGTPETRFPLSIRDPAPQTPPRIIWLHTEDERAGSGILAALAAGVVLGGRLPDRRPRAERGRVPAPVPRLLGVDRVAALAVGEGPITAAGPRRPLESLPWIRRPPTGRASFPKAGSAARCHAGSPWPPSPPPGSASAGGEADSGGDRGSVASRPCRPTPRAKRSGR